MQSSWWPTLTIIDKNSCPSVTMIDSSSKHWSAHSLIRGTGRSLDFDSRTPFDMSLCGSILHLKRALYYLRPKLCWKDEETECVCLIAMEPLGPGYLFSAAGKHHQLDHGEGGGGRGFTASCKHHSIPAPYVLTPTWNHTWVLTSYFTPWKFQFLVNVEGPVD